VTIHTIDVSSHQGTIDWNAVATCGVKGAWIKVGGADGGLYRDSQAYANLDRVARTNLPYGTYYFSNPQVGQGAAQAQHAVSCGLGSGLLSPALDLEWHNGLTGAQLDRFALDFIHEVERLRNRRVIVYTGAWIGVSATGYFGNNPELAQYPLWIANYGRANTPGTTPPAGIDPPVPPAWKTASWSMWQFNSVTTIPGIVTNTCDQNAAKESFWTTQTGEPDWGDYLMRQIIVQGEAAQWRLVDDAHGVLRRQHIDSLELVKILSGSEVIRDDPLVLTDPAMIDRFNRIPVTGTTVAEVGLINVAANIVKSLQSAIAGIDVGGDVDEGALADALVQHFASHLTNEPPA
jgi:GH25 family lysozyme M1 (1,4-beta-N-acetylmuramidase)